MKKLFTLFFTVLCLVILGKDVNAQLLLTDDFTGLTSGSNLAGQGTWTKGGSGPDVTVQNSSPITYSGYGGGGQYVLMPSPSGTSSRVYKGFTSTAAGTNTFYFSFLLNLSSTSASSAGYFITLGDPTTGTNYFARVFAQTSGAGYVLGLSKQSNTATYGTTVFTYGTTYLVLVRYTFVSGSANDLAYMWVNPSLVSEPSTASAEATVPASQTDPSITNIGNVLWHNRGTTNPVGRFDAIQVAYGATSAAAWNNLEIPLPVELSSFTSTVNKNNVKLNWNTTMEQNNSGFDIERKNKNGEWIRVANVQGNGTSNLTHSYSFEDRNLLSGNYNYRLKQIDYNGNYEYFDLSNEVIVGVPNKFDLSQNYPNPFNPSTSINYELPLNNFVSLKIYDMMGREVMQLLNETKEAGYYTVKFDAGKLSSGMYFYNLKAGDFSSTKKMMLVK